jgi:hypothetical protein
MGVKGSRDIVFHGWCLEASSSSCLRGRETPRSALEIRWKGTPTLSKAVVSN